MTIRSIDPRIPNYKFGGRNEKILGKCPDDCAAALRVQDKNLRQYVRFRLLEDNSLWDEICWKSGLDKSSLSDFVFGRDGVYSANAIRIGQVAHGLDMDIADLYSEAEVAGEYIREASLAAAVANKDREATLQLLSETGDELFKFIDDSKLSMKNEQLNLDLSTLQLSGDTGAIIAE